mgnify:CR=1 FL=1
MYFLISLISHLPEQYVSIFLTSLKYVSQKSSIFKNQNGNYVQILAYYQKFILKIIVRISSKLFFPRGN